MLDLVFTPSVGETSQEESSPQRSAEPTQSQPTSLPAIYDRTEARRSRSWNSVPHRLQEPESKIPQHPHETKRKTRHAPPDPQIAQRTTKERNGNPPKGRTTPRFTHIRLKTRINLTLKDQGQAGTPTQETTNLAKDDAQKESNDHSRDTKGRRLTARRRRSDDAAPRRTRWHAQTDEMHLTNVPGEACLN